MIKLLSITETSIMLGVSVQTLYTWVHHKKIPHTKIYGKLKFREDELIGMIEENSYHPDS